jgi:hypothetical protein
MSFNVMVSVYLILDIQVKKSNLWINNEVKNKRLQEIKQESEFFLKVFIIPTIATHDNERKLRNRFKE